MKKHYLFSVIAVLLTALTTAQVSGELHQVWENGQWKNHLHIVPITFTPNNLAVTESLTSSWNDLTQTWENQERVLNSYMLGDILTESLQQLWDSSTSQWVNETLEIRDPTQALHRTTKTWDGNAWQNTSFVYTESFNSIGLSIYVYQNWISGQWENDARVSYDAGTHEQIRQVWQNGDWVNETRSVVEDDGIQAFYQWVNDQWEPTKRMIWQTDGNTQTESYDAATQTWHPESRQIVAVESINLPEISGDVTVSTAQLYTDGAWTNSYRIILDQGNLLGNPEAAKPVVAVYPNPTTGALNLQNFADDYAIFTADGRRVGGGAAIEPATSIDVSRFQSGVYLIRTAGKTLRFIKQ